MAIKVKPASSSADKYVSRGASSGAAYREGVQNPKQSWESATKASKEAYSAGVQDAISRGAFEKGVSKAGDAKYTAKAMGTGANRLGQGITDAKADYQSGVEPYLAVIGNLTLPPRGPKGSPNNIARVAAVAAALRQKKLAG